MKHKIEKMFWADLCIALFGVLADQFTKYLAVTCLKDRPAFPLIPGVLELRYLENRGAAFGILQGGKTIFLIITPIVLLAAAKLLFPEGIAALSRRAAVATARFFRISRMDIASFHRVLRLSAGHFAPLYHSRMPPARKTAADPPGSAAGEKG